MNGFLNLRVTKKRRNSTLDIPHFTFGQDGCRLNKVGITRVSTKIGDGSISEINQCEKGNTLAKCDAFNLKAHNFTQILLISTTIVAKNANIMGNRR